MVTILCWGAAVTRHSDPTIKWEETETYDFGFESVFWNRLEHKLLLEKN